jgi:hypothetical protein
MKTLVLVAVTLSVAACEARDPVASEANNTAGLPDIATNAPDPTGAPPDEAATASKVPMPAEPGPPVKAIPAAFHGRWGLTPGDCTSTRGDAKGLLTITDDKMRFYESTAVPAESLASDSNSIRGNFDFAGEGQTWKRFQSLRVEGRKLTRTESNPSASYIYAKCD